MAKKLGGLGKGLGAIFIENDNEENGGAVKLKISEIEPKRAGGQHRQARTAAADTGQTPDARRL